MKKLVKSILVVIGSFWMTINSFAQNGGEEELDSVSLEIMVGQMIITGIGDFSSISKEEKILDEIEQGHVGGVVLFTKNINDKHPKK